MNFKNLKLTKKIAIGTGIPLMLLVALAVISITSANSMQESGEMVEHTTLLPDERRTDH